MFVLFTLYKCFELYPKNKKIPVVKIDYLPIVKNTPPPVEFKVVCQEHIPEDYWYSCGDRYSFIKHCKNCDHVMKGIKGFYNPSSNIVSPTSGWEPP